MKPLLTVFAYGGADGMIDRHYTSWEKSGCDILLSFPVDAPCARGGLAFDRSCHHGAPVMRRIFRTFEHVLKTTYDAFIFIEADSICTGKAPIRFGDGLHCFLLPNDDPAFQAKQYPHWAWAMNRQTLTRLSRASDRYNPGQEQGFCDRLVGLICEQSGIEMIHRPDLSYSRNRLDRPEFIAEAKAAIAGGARFVHGIKTQADLASLRA